MLQFRNEGFTLIETIVVMTIFAIGVSIALPNLMAMGRSNAVKAEARKLKDVLAKTRMDAVRRNQALTVTVDTTANSCTVSVTGGADVSTTDFIRVQLASSPDSLSIVWDTKGMTNNNCTISLIGAEATYQVIVSLAGNIRIAKL